MAGASRSLLSHRFRRRQAPGRFRLHKPKWLDPFPQIPGTEPEKRIFEALVKLRIFFIFQGQIPELNQGLYVTLAIPGYKPDFILPQYKIILDPFSPYHHSLPGAAERDARKIGLYTALGYKVYHPWAEANGLFVMDQQGYKVWRQGKQREMRGRFMGATDMLLSIPELQRAPRFPNNLTKKQRLLKRSPGYELGPYLGLGATSVGAANKKRKKPKPIGLATGSRRRTRRGGGTYK